MTNNIDTPEPSPSLYPKTAAEALERWDAGDSLFTIEMGGLGPGYEQAIQLFVMEIIRKAIADKTPIENEVFQKMADECLKQVDETGKTLDDRIGGLTGAMYGAAVHLSAKYLRDGWEKTIRSCEDHAKKEGKESRIIQISKDFPKV